MMSETSAMFEWPGSRAVDSLRSVNCPLTSYGGRGDCQNVDYKDVGHSVFIYNEPILHPLLEFFKKSTNHPVTSTTNLQCTVYLASLV